MPANLDQLTCPGCGYALRGLPGNVCPECGRTFDADALLQERLHPRRDQSALMAALALLAGAGSVPATIALGLQAVAYHGDHGCCRSFGPSDGLMSTAVITIILLVPCSAVLGTFLSGLPPRIVSRLGRIGLLAMATSWMTLIVLLAMAG